MSLEYKIIPVTNFIQNCTLLWDNISKEAVIIDVGGDIDLVINIIKKYQVKLQAIWITHGHIDHIGGIANFIKYFNIPIIGPNIQDKFWIDQIVEYAKIFGIDNALPFVPDQWLNDNDKLFISNKKFKVFHTPGHSPGSVAFYCESEKLLIAGDVIFKESIGRTDLPQGDYATLMKSIKEKIINLPDDTNIIPGHGQTTTIFHEKHFNQLIKNFIY